HHHLTALLETLEVAVGGLLIRHGDRQREALEARLALGAAVGAEHHRLADAELRVHHLVAAARRGHLGVRALLVAANARDVGAERLLVMGEGLLAAALEEEVGLHLGGRGRARRCHCGLPFDFGWFGDAAARPRPFTYTSNEKGRNRQLEAS